MQAHLEPGAAMDAAVAVAMGQGARSLKRKKTVTWADGEMVQDMEDSEEEEAGPLAGAPSPAVVVVAAPADALFEGLDEGALQQQAAGPKGEGEALTKEELLMRRAGHVGQLIAAYEAEVWALADELLLRRAQLQTSNPQAALLKGGAPAPISLHPGVAAAAAKGGMEAAWEAMHRRRHGRGAPAAPPALPGYDEIEDLVASMPLPQGDELEALRLGLVARREAFLRRAEVMGRLESAAAAASARELDAAGAVAALCGKRCRYLLRQTAVVLGRRGEGGKGKEAAKTPGQQAKQQQRQRQEEEAEGGEVDVDLTLEAGEGAAAAAALSRRQAHLFLDVDGGFKVRCVGRRNMGVNGRVLAQGEVAALPHLSLLRAGGVALLFVVNRAALDRLSKRSAALTVY